MFDLEVVWLVSCVNNELKILVFNIFFVFEGKIIMDEVLSFVCDSLFFQGKLSGINI